jgi:DNA-binding LytR/AlgR family response regulator
MRLAIVDDESAYRRHIVEMIDSVYGKSEVSCYLYSDGSELIRSFENGFKLDAVFLDIEMKDVDGMTAAKKIREYSKDIPVIFLTSHTELAMDGYEVDAFRFLGKPLNEDKLRETLTDLEKKLKVDEKIVLHKDGEEIIYPVSNLIYVEASNNSVRFCFRGDNVELRMKFADAIRLVDDASSDFIKIHRSYYINLAHVKKLSATDVILDNNEVLPVARSASADAKKRLLEFIRRNSR